MYPICFSQPAASQARLPLGSPNDRRCEYRVNYRVACRVRRLAHDGAATDDAAEGETLNVSSHGLHLQTSRSFDVGVKVAVELLFFDEIPSTIKGHVLHCRRAATGSYHVGVEIDEIHPNCT